MCGKGGMHGERGGMCGKGGHAWQKRGACMVKGGHAWQKGDMHGEGGCVWQGGMHGKRGGMHGKRGACMICTPPSMRYGQSMCRQYASYWNAFL